VNETGRALLAITPDLRIQFGLHATSIVGNYPDLEELDPRISIIWEDAGVMPYDYQLAEEGHFGNRLNPYYFRNIFYFDAIAFRSKREC
jgi:hypothetical protein